MNAFRRYFAVASIALAVAGCATRTPYELSDKDKERFIEVARADRGAGHPPLIFGISDCTVYKAVTKDQQIVDWRMVLRSDWGQESYPKFLTACVDEHVQYHAPYVSVVMCARAIGAGGGCNGGGTYRSRYGERWQFQGNSGRWYPLPK